MGIFHLIRHLVCHLHEAFFSAFPVPLRIHKDASFNKRGFINDAIEEPFNSIKGLSMLPDEERGAVSVDIQMRAALNEVRLDFGINPHPMEQFPENRIGGRRNILLNRYSDFCRFRAKI